MPIYEFKCDECKARKEVDRPMSEAGNKEMCQCGRDMRRLFSPPRISIPETGRKKVLDVLNNEPGGRRLPGGHKHSARYEAALARGLDQPRPAIGRGFG